MAGKWFLRKVTNRLRRYPADQKYRRNRSILLCFGDKYVFVFNAEIQDDRQKWRENNFCEKSPVDSTDTLRLKNFVEIALSRTVSEINAFLRLRRNSRWPPKVAGKWFLQKLASRLWKYPVGQKSRSVSEINAFLHFQR